MGQIRVLEVLASGALGGGATHVAALARGLDPDRYDVQVACSPDGPLLSDLADAGIVVHPVRLFGRFNLGGVLALWRLISSHRIQIVHYHGTRAGLPGCMAARLTAAAGVYTVHGWACHPRRDPLSPGLARLVERTISHASDVVVCVSQGDLATGLKLGLVNPARSRVIPNGVDPENCIVSGKSLEQRRELGLHPGQRAIGLVGRLTEQKGQHLLIAAAPKILARHPEAVVVLVGDGTQRTRLENDARQRGIRDRVVFAGPRRDIPALMAALDVFVLPSLWEGMPISLLEAMAAGKPVVASDVHGSAEVVTDGETGLLVRRGDVAALAEAVCRVLEDTMLAAKLGEAARRKVRDSYHVHSMIDGVGALYDALVASEQIRTRARR
ncbi:MAG: glycosyltransferase family 4 protein [Cyanobacteria bacterium REEB65]|nr:glycosyltransferase family 4 protein [Cyanobacteria bacterium REEB65]